MWDVKHTVDFSMDLRGGGVFEQPKDQKKNTEAHNQTCVLTAHNPEAAVCHFVMEI
jgi:hypothetical protein